MIDNQEISIRDIKEEIDAHGPVDAVLRDFHSHSIDSNQEMPYESLRVIPGLHEYQDNEIIGYERKNFINKGYSFAENAADQTFNTHQDDNHMKHYYNESAVQQSESKSKLFMNHRVPKKTRRREMKFYRKLHSRNIDATRISSINKQEQYEPWNTGVNKPKERRNLVLKASVYPESRSKAAKSNNFNTDSTRSLQIEESKTHQLRNRRFKDCLSSTSTLSNEKEDRLGKKYAKITEAFIELANNTKIICREVGPLKAEDRRMKVLHYFEKKRNRKWQKRINYTYVVFVDKPIK